jgi:protein-tyrosine phosphatase
VSRELIDLHCHILPGLDDGALDLEDSVAMATQAAEDGIELVCATPHIRSDHDVAIPDLSRRVAALNEELERAGVATRVLTGGEVAETALRGLDEEELAAVSLGGGGRWVLLEPAPGPLGDPLLAAVHHLARRGRGSIIAHPERHPSADLEQRLTALVEAGALVQATAAHLEEEGSFMLGLAERGLVHLLGSDAHSSHGGRPVRLAAAFDLLRDHVPHADWMAEAAPAAIVAGEEVTPPFPPHPGAGGG